jgi:hypothetical protein
MNQFTTLESILTDPLFSGFVAAEVRRIENERAKVINEARSFFKNKGDIIEPKLKRNPFDFLQEKSIIGADQLINEYRKIIAKDPDKHPKCVRDYIEDIIHNASMRLALYYKNLEDQQAKLTKQIVKKPRAKNPRAKNPTKKLNNL